MLDPGLLDLMVLVHGKVGGSSLWFVSSPCDLEDGSTSDLDGSIPQEGRARGRGGISDSLIVLIDRHLRTDRGLGKAPLAQVPYELP